MVILLKPGRVAMERKDAKPSSTGTLHSEILEELIDVPFTLQMIASLLLCWQRKTASPCSTVLLSDDGAITNPVQ
jgi:hypothetical protein